MTDKQFESLTTYLDGILMVLVETARTETGEHAYRQVSRTMKRVAELAVSDQQGAKDANSRLSSEQQEASDATQQP